MILGIAGSAGASSEPSLSRYKECLFQVSVYGSIVSTLRDQGHEIDFNEVERAHNFVDFLVTYGINEYGAKKAKVVSEEIGGPLWMNRARELGKMFARDGIETGIARMDVRIRECEVIWDQS
ncbi:hypothetical protein [Marivita hallyeonensis]|uniref:hypothetical protein n=1 Tax=Marivita hallyeonensis TaxID=996342 RepID=UPI001160D83A|nr:hypothetical protein [Marivita hallyeonensis]